MKDAAEWAFIAAGLAAYVFIALYHMLPPLVGIFREIRAEKDHD